MSSLLKYLRTSIYLKPEQLLFRLYYSARKKSGFFNKDCKYQKITFTHLKKPHSQKVPDSIYINDNTFTFLNKSKKFNNGIIDWNYLSYGLLWAYNLNYFDFLFSSNLTKETGSVLMRDYIKSYKKNTVGPQAYPSSVRGINWIKYISLNKISDQSIITHLFCQYIALNSNIEYDVSGNHLIENACSLIFAGIFFHNNTFYKKGMKILSRELKEQVLDDGAHYELSPMYHNIILYRLIDLIIVLEQSTEQESQFISLIKSKVQLMMKWAGYFSLPDGSFPNLGDSSLETAPTFEELKETSSIAKLTVPDVADYYPGESGFRKFESGNLIFIIKGSNIKAKHQPGHIHNDVLSFVLYYSDQPVIVDTGVSTYEENDRRILERSIISHNSIIIDNTEPNEFWKSFRVGRRAKSKITLDNNYKFIALSDRYANRKKKHQRSVFKEEGSIRIGDTIINKDRSDCYSYIHFHPTFNFSINNNRITGNGIDIIFNGYESIETDSYYYSVGFNKLKQATLIKSRVNTSSEIVIIDKKA